MRALVPLPIAAIDLEASCLPDYGRSYPIEVALCSVGGDVLFSALIKPHPSWFDWDWNPTAERLHGISRERLRAEGRSCAEVMADLNAVARDLRVVSDSQLDQTWVQTLAEAAEASPDFSIVLLKDILADYALRPVDRDMVAVASERAFLKFPEVHRATPDAQRLAETIRLLAVGSGGG